jgi:hypothetical protein
MDALWRDKICPLGEYVSNHGTRDVLNPTEDEEDQSQERCGDH